MGCRQGAFCQGIRPFFERRHDLANSDLEHRSQCQLQQSRRHFVFQMKVDIATTPHCSEQPAIVDKPDRFFTGRGADCQTSRVDHNFRHKRLLEAQFRIFNIKACAERPSAITKVMVIPHPGSGTQWQEFRIAGYICNNLKQIFRRKANCAGCMEAGHQRAVQTDSLAALAARAALRRAKSSPA